MRTRAATVFGLVREVFKVQDEDYLTYAPWRGRFGIHYLSESGQPFRVWSNNPYKWIIGYARITKGVSIKAAFLYFRLSRRRLAVVVSTHIRSAKKNGAHDVTGNAQ